jgi:hypothetical protein
MGKFKFKYWLVYYAMNELTLAKLAAINIPIIGTTYILPSPSSC